MAGLAPKFLDLLRKHLELGTSLRCMAMTDDQKDRVKRCMEVYNLMKQNPYLDYATYLKNKYNRSYWEIRNDKECIDFITSILDAGGKNISRFRVKKTYEMAMKTAHDQGDVKNMISAAKHLSDLEKLTEPEQGEDLENSIAKLPPIFTPDARKVLPGKTYSDERQLDRIRAKWGVQKDPHQQMVEEKTAEILQRSSVRDISNEEYMSRMPGILDADKHTEAEKEMMSHSVNAIKAKWPIDLSSLDASQLAELQCALNARIMEVEQPEAEELDDEDEED